METNIYPEIIILGSTGSVGEQAIDVAIHQGVKVNALSADKNSARVEKQARILGVKACAMNNEDAARDLRERLKDTDIKVYAGSEGICEMAAKSYDESGRTETVVNSILGEAGLLPTLSVLHSGKKLALANKESLVVGGEIVMQAAKDSGNEILPVDSEHCAIFQCLRAGAKKEIKKIILTASGGPFFGYTKEQLENITIEQTLSHPTWKMGAKITVDSATLMNKGFEVIEAVHLFGVSPDKIQVTVHKESIIHSAVEYIDNSIIAQMSLPDMRHCVQYALTHPHRCDTCVEELDLFKIDKLTFFKPDTETFGLLRLAVETIKKGGALPGVLNAANEEAVSAFLSGQIRFCDIQSVVSETVDSLDSARDMHTLDSIFEAALQARKIAVSKIHKFNK